MVKPPTVTLDRKIFELARAVAVSHEVPLRDLVEEVLLAAFVGEEAFHPSEQDQIDMLSKLAKPWRVVHPRSLRSSTCSKSIVAKPSAGRRCPSI